MEIIERKSEPILIFMADKTSAGAWNLPLYKMFADPFTTAGLVIAPTLHQGFRFEVHDIREHKKITFDGPEDLYDMLMFIGSPGKYTVKHVFSRADGTIAAASSTERLSLIAGKYVGKDDPVMIVRAQQNFPAVGEVLDPFRYPWIIEGWMRGSHYGPLMPVSVKQATPPDSTARRAWPVSDFNWPRDGSSGRATCSTIRPTMRRGGTPIEWQM